MEKSIKSFAGVSICEKCDKFSVAREEHFREGAYIMSCALVMGAFEIIFKNLANLGEKECIRSLFGSLKNPPTGRVKGRGYLS